MPNRDHLDSIQQRFADLTAKLEDIAALAARGQGVSSTSAAELIAHDLHKALQAIAYDLVKLRECLR